MVFGGLRRRHGGEVGYLIEELGGVLNAITFIVFGAVMLGPALGDVTWAIAAYAVLSLTLVRMLPVGIAMLGTGARRPTVGFLGWFGPRGLASIVFAVILVEEGGLPHDDVIIDRDRDHDRALGARPRAHGGPARRTATRPGSSRTRATPSRSSRAAARPTSAGAEPGRQRDAAADSIAGNPTGRQP